MYIFVRMHVYTCIPTFIPAYMHTNIHACILTTHILSYTHTLTHTQTDVHTHISVFILFCRPLLLTPSPHLCDSFPAKVDLRSEPPAEALLVHQKLKNTPLWAATISHHDMPHAYVSWLNPKMQSFSSTRIWKVQVIICERTRLTIAWITLDLMSTTNCYRKYFGSTHVQYFCIAHKHTYPHTFALLEAMRGHTAYTIACGCKSDPGSFVFGPRKLFHSTIANLSRRIHWYHLEMVQCISLRSKDSRIHEHGPG